MMACFKAKTCTVAAVFYIIHTIHILTINMTTNQCTKQNTKSPSMDGTLVLQHLAALIIVMNSILLNEFVGSAGSVTTIKLCSMDKLIGLYETEMLATELSQCKHSADIYLCDKELGNALTEPAILTGEYHLQHVSFQLLHHHIDTF